MTFFDRLRALWRSFLNIPNSIRILVGPPPYDEDHERPTEPGLPAVDLRDPKVSPIEGDVFAGPYGGIRHFRGFDPETGEALFTRADRPGPCRETRVKWLAWVKKATIVAKNEHL